MNKVPVLIRVGRAKVECPLCGRVVDLLEALPPSINGRVPHLIGARCLGCGVFSAAPPQLVVDIDQIVSGDAN